MRNKLTETKFKSTIRLARNLLVTAVISLWVGPVGAVQPATVTGGGTGTFYADLDGDGEIDGSHFGFGVMKNPGGSVLGHFMCQMAGN